MALSLASFAAAPALADCLDTNTTASTNGQQGTGISKDGTHAPLEPNAGLKAPGAQSAQKDGKSMPLATQEGGGDENLATSQQDVEAQQKGGKTAAAQAKDDRCAD
jgi:hypothetical protein